MIQNNVLNILHLYILGFIFSELILNLFKNISDFSTNLLFLLSEEKNIIILVAIYIIEISYYLILQYIIF